MNVTFSLAEQICLISYSFKKISKNTKVVHYVNPQGRQLVQIYRENSLNGNEMKLIYLNSTSEQIVTQGNFRPWLHLRRVAEGARINGKMKLNG